MNSTIDRWNIFLSKIRDKGEELLRSMREQAVPLFKNHKGDPVPVGTALHATYLQLLRLQQKIDDTWESQVGEAFEKARLSSSQIENEHKKGAQLQFSLMREFRLMEIDVYYEMANYILSLAAATKPGSVNCTQCTAALVIPEHTYTAERITCKFCQTINTYEPGTYQRMVGSFCADHLARWEALELIKAEIEIEGQLRELRDDAYQKGKQKLRAACQASSEKYLSELKKYHPTLDIDKELEIVMRRY
jgi:hypothetical protein